MPATRPPTSGARGRCSTSRCWSRTRCATSSGATANTCRKTRSASMPRSSSAGRSAASRCGCSGSTPRAISSKPGIDTPYFQTGETKYGKPIIDRVITRITPARRRHEVRAGVVRFDDAQQPVGRHADRSDLLRARQPRSADAAPLRRRRRVFHGARATSGAKARARCFASCPSSLVTRRGNRRLPHHLRARRQPDPRAAIAPVPGTAGAARLAPRLRSRRADDGAGRWRRPSMRRSWPRPSAACSSISIARSAIRDCSRAPTRDAPAALRAEIVERHYRPYRDAGRAHSSRNRCRAAGA